MSPKSIAVGVVYFDAGDSGFGKCFKRCGQNFVSGTWSATGVHSFVMDWPEKTIMCVRPLSCSPSFASCVQL